MNSSNKVPDVEETNVGVHALLIIPDGQMVLQQRDTNINLINSGLISMFGGTIKKGEDLEFGLKRELIEELGEELENYRIEKFRIYYKTKEIDGVDWEVNVFLVRDVDLNKLKLMEGKGFVVGKARELVANPKLTRITKLAIDDYIKRIY